MYHKISRECVVFMLYVCCLLSTRISLTREMSGKKAIQTGKGWFWPTALWLFTNYALLVLCNEVSTHFIFAPFSVFIFFSLVTGQYNIFPYSNCIFRTKISSTVVSDAIQSIEQSQNNNSKKLKCASKSMINNQYGSAHN